MRMICCAVCRSSNPIVKSFWLSFGFNSLSIMFTIKSHAALLITAVSVIALNVAQSQDGILVTSTSYHLSSQESRLLSSGNSSVKAPDPSLLLNTTVPNLPSASNDVHIRCSYGHELHMDDCTDALNTFLYPPDRNLTIAQRHEGHPHWDLDLPVRWMSGNSFHANAKMSLG